MIVFDLECREGGHRFEGWFGSSQDFAQQQERGLLACPSCGSSEVAKAVMAPNVGRKGNQTVAKPHRQIEDKAAGSDGVAAGGSSGAKPPAPVASKPLPPEAIEMITKLATLQAEALKSSRYVGRTFAEDVRAMHYGERDHEVVHGETSAEEAIELLEEGIAIAPLPFPVAPPDKTN
ncbi:DUF1178 family protein [Novosphingobium aquimarinum]|uniref:DUF1178 family protein n=1 Tax=Novosphingobium aquimarinum TaxID=2682494 RepID=UPI0012EB8435|nr:DUF1178 family protein [Novosphingobium aquimarinum]